MTRNRIAVVTVAVLTAAGLLSGCSLSTMDKPRRIGSGLDAQSDVASYQAPRSADGIRDPQELVEAYLNAAAGGGEEATERLLGFLTGKARGSLPPDQNQPFVVRPVRFEAKPEVDGVTQVKVTVQWIGVLKPSEGKIEPEQRDQKVLDFEVVATGGVNGSQQLQLGNVPPMLLLQDEALRTYYRATPVYYWDKSRQVLVPDVRYVSRAVARDRRLDAVVDFLLAGPSSWLESAVFPVREGTKQYDVVNETEPGVLMVNLSSAAFTNDDEATKLMSQLRWTLAAAYGGSVQVALQIEGIERQIDGTSARYLAANATDALLRAATTYRVRLTDAKRRLEQVGAPKQPLVLSDKTVNSDVVTAAVNRDATLAAFVRKIGDELSLWVVKAGQDAARPQARQVQTDHATAISRPTWLYGTNKAVVAIDGMLDLIDGDGKRTPLVAADVVGVTQVSAAADGRRLALIAGGRLHFASVTVDRSTVTVNKAWPGTLNFTATGVVWSSENQVIVLGTAEGSTVSAVLHSDGAAVVAASSDPSDEIQLDSAESAVLQGLNDLSAYPVPPSYSGLTVDVLVQVKGKVYRYLPGSGAVRPVEDSSLDIYPN